MNRAFGFIACVSTVAAACLPRGDLDAAARGSAGAAGDQSGATSGPVAGAGSGGSTGSSSVSSSQAGGDAGQQPAGNGASSGSAAGSSGSVVGSGGSVVGSGGSAAGSSGSVVGSSAAGASGAPPVPQRDLPIYLPDSPLAGEVSITGDALWEVNGKAEPTFEIHTPSANYWLVKSLGAVVSLTDTATSDARQWIGYSSFRPARGVPSYASSGISPTFTTALDGETQTPQHVRLRSETTTADLRLVWDFYLTHVTLSVEAAPSSFAFSYRGVPAGGLDGEDSLLTADGVTHGAFSFWSADDFPGIPEWVAVADPKLERALFLIQHYDDDVPDRYQVKDNDSALVSFGARQTSYSARYSLGLLDSVDFSGVESRVKFVDAAMR
jgi:hypothetical protein